MFSNLLNEKSEIEERIKKIQNQYITLIRQINNPSNEQINQVNKILEHKIHVLKQIKSIYLESAEVHKELRNLLEETKEAALSTEKVIDLVTESLDIDYPDELKSKPVRKYVTPVPQIRIIQENQLSDNNIEEKYSKTDSDKENSKSDFAEYFSPNIQIRKSFVTDENLYTPAIRSQTKFRRLTIMQNIPNVTRLNETIRILGFNPGIMTLQGTNSYLIGTSKRRLLLDTTDPDKTEYIQQLKNVLHEEQAKITDVVITHWHYDHIGCLNKLREEKVINEECSVWKYPRSDLNENFDELKLLKLSDQQEFAVDENIKLKIFHTPGHTTDHVILFNMNDKTLYSGDCILGEGTAVFEDLYDYMNSLKIILDLKPEKIYPGHGNIITNACEKIQYYIHHREDRERQILETLSLQSPKTIMEIVQTIYKDTPENLWKAAAFNVHHHLTKLKREEKVRNLNNKDNEEYWEISLKSNKL